MVAAREQIFDRIDTVLKAVTGVQSYEAEPSGDPDDFPAIQMFDAGQSPNEGQEALGTDQLALSVTVVGYVQLGTGATARAARNEFHAAIVLAMMSDATLLAMIETIDVGDFRTFRANLANERRLAFEQDFAIGFATPRGDPSQFA
jgi:hypothetical protein